MVALGSELRIIRLNAVRTRNEKRRLAAPLFVASAVRYEMNTLMTKQIAKPVSPTRVFITVQDLSVSETLMPK